MTPGEDKDMIMDMVDNGHSHDGHGYGGHGNGGHRHGGLDMVDVWTWTWWHHTILQRIPSPNSRTDLIQEHLV